jgi:hypothetical protein
MKENNNIKMDEIERKIRENIGNYIETPWTIIQSYFKDQHLMQLIRHQIESYNDFVMNQIRNKIM